MGFQKCQNENEHSENYYAYGTLHLSRWDNLWVEYRR
jgi:hypothetical protein